MPTFLTSVIAIVIVISRFLKPYSKAKRTRAPAYSRALRRIKGFFQKGVKRSSGPISRIPGGGRVAVKVGVFQMEKVNDRMGGRDPWTWIFFTSASRPSNPRGRGVEHSKPNECIDSFKRPLVHALCINACAIEVN